ncbi:hypothetical protein KRMM14A1259_68860 [Krasilnikovia sp. MM14-A1259]
MLPVETVRARLIAGHTSYLRAAFMFGGWGEHRVIGRVGIRRVSLEAVTVGVRNSWRPVMRGHLEPDGTGSRLVGRLGWSPFVRAFSALWLAGVVCVFLVGVIHAAVSAWSGDVGGEVFVPCLVSLGFLAFFVGLTAWGIYAGRRDADYLRSWLTDRVQTADAGIPGYRPWRGETLL